MKVDFRNEYERGDIIYLTRYIEAGDVKEVNMLTLRTVKKDYMVGYLDKGNAFVIGKEWINNVFANLKDAKAYLKTISKNAKPIISEDDLDTRANGDDENE